MKKMLAIGFLAIFCLTAAMPVFARTKYTSRGKIVDSDTIRGRRSAVYEAKAAQKRNYEAAAAARLNYEEMAKAFSNTQNTTNNKQK